MLKLAPHFRLLVTYLQPICRVPTSQSLAFRNEEQEKQYDHLLKWHVGPIPKVKYT